MNDAWPALCTALALVVLLVLIIRYKLQAFVALVVVSIGLGLAAGMPPEKVLASVGTGLGKIMTDVAVILALGAMLGRMLDVSGAAEVIARTLINAFGTARASLAILAAAYIIGIPILFNVGFLLLIPVMWRLQRDTGKSLLWFALPLVFSMGLMHSLVPPHPGIVGAVTAFGERAPGRIMVETILFGTLLGVPIVLVGWFGPGRWWASRQFVTVPDKLAPPIEQTAPPSEMPENAASAPSPSFSISLLVVTLPLLLSLFGFGARLLGDLDRLPAWMMSPVCQAGDLPEWLLAKPDRAKPVQADDLKRPPEFPRWLLFLSHPPLSWVRFLGEPAMALLVTTGLAFLVLGRRRGLGCDQLGKLAGDALQDVGSMLFLFGAAGGFKQVIQDTGAGDYIAQEVMKLPLSPVAVAYLVAVLVRLALGSATAAILTASALLAGLAKSLPGQETLLILAVANGVTFATQPADSGFWLLKEYCNLSVRDVMFRFNACRIIMSLTGVAILLIVEALRK